MWTVTEQKVKKSEPFQGLPSGFTESKMYVDMCWYDRQYLVIATLAGDLIIISQFDTYQVIEDVAPSKICKVAEFEGGLAIGCEKG